MTLNIKHRQVELTEAITSYVHEKMQILTKSANAIQHMDVEVGKTTAHHKNGNVFMCKAVFTLLDGEVVRVDREASDLYKAIDKVRDHMRYMLSKRNQQRLEASIA
jgi:ribosomal subunit interface protein